ncbi:MAG: hypothetical protein R3E79_44525 [Caldilineaceae bacterium]
MNEAKKEKQIWWRMIAGIAVAILFVATLALRITGWVEFDEIALALYAFIVGSIIFALSHQLGIAKITMGPLEIEMPLVEQTIQDIANVSKAPPGQKTEVWRVLNKHTNLFPIIGVRVLWVDDHPEELIPHRRLLRQLGIEVVSVISTEAATAELVRDGDFAMIIQDHLRHGDVDDSRALVKWLDDHGSVFNIERIPLVIFSWDPFDRSIGIKEWNWFTKNFASLLHRIASEIQQWKTNPPAAQDRQLTF